MPITATFDGDASLRKRPMRRILDPLLLMGAQVLEEAEGGRCPDHAAGHARAAADRISHARRLGADQIGGAARRPQFAGPHHRDRDARPRATTPRKCCRISAPRSAVEPHGAHGRKITLDGRPELRARPVVVPADPSSAAFPLVAALIVPGSDIVVEGVMMNPLRSGLLTTLLEMGADIDVREPPHRGRRGGRRSARACSPAPCAASTCRPRARPR